MRGLSSNCRRAEDAEGERGKVCARRPRRATVYTAPVGGTKKIGEKGRGGGSVEKKKELHDRAFLVASIHVSSVTRVMSVGNTRFLESSGTVFSFRPLIPRLISLSFSLSFFSPAFPRLTKTP